MAAGIDEGWRDSARRNGGGLRQLVRNGRASSDDGGGKDVFVHQSAIESSGLRSLAEGDRVEFQTEQGAKGPQAKDVKKL